MTILLLLAAGAPLARSRDALRWLAESFLLGAGVAFGLMFCQSLAGIPWTRPGVFDRHNSPQRTGETSFSKGLERRPGLTADRKD